MNPKKMLTNGVFCPMPWAGLMYNFDGTVKNCIRSAGRIGNICHDPIEDILVGDKNINTQELMLRDQPGPDCHPCYNLEKNKKRFDIVSDRIFYIKELKSLPMETYKTGNHELSTVDVRWTNLCNFSCVYCSPEFSSKWEDELSVRLFRPDPAQVTAFKEYIFSKAENLKHVYLSGGEPLLMKENIEFLDLLKEKNPTVNLRVNTNLSKVDSRVFERICEFENVHWTISGAESLDDKYEYIRYGGEWQNFLHNLGIIRQLPHRITFNMLLLLLNFNDIFRAIDFFTEIGIHPNSFVIGPIHTPGYLNVRHLPDCVLNSMAKEIERRIGQQSGYLLEDSFRNILDYIRQPFQKNLTSSMEQLRLLDQRRKQDSKKVFPELYSIYKEHYGQTI